MNFLSDKARSKPKKSKAIFKLRKVCYRKARLSWEKLRTLQMVGSWERLITT